VGRRDAIIGATCGAWAAGCNVIFGIDDLSSEPVASTSSTAAVGGGATVASSSSGQVGGAMSSGGSGGAGGCPNCLVDSGLVVRYFMDEADSGQAPLMLVDAAPNPLPLTIDYNDELSFTGGPGKRGLEWSSGGTGARALAPIANTKVLSMLHGSTQATIETVVEIDAILITGSVLAMIGNGGEFGDLSLVCGGADQLGFFWQGGADIYVWDGMVVDSGRLVLHVVLDSTNADPLQHARYYINGMQHIEGRPTVDPGQTIDLHDDASLAIGSGVGSPFSPRGIIAYVAYYNAALSDADIMVNVARLIASDDTQ
jgi:hypothetical protein